ncbi:MAG: hypothetical protein WAT39_05640 [Planctomycetota bacterium]
MELAVILIPIFAFVLVKIVLDHRAAARADNVRVLEEALKSPHLDRPTLESLTYQLTGHRAPRQAAGGSKFLAFVLAIGWIALFVGIGLWVAGAMLRGGDDMEMAGILIAVTGFGFVTYPFALRELDARRQTP